MKEFIEFIAKNLVDKPDKVIVDETTSDGNTIELTLRVDKSDIGKVIGKKGNTVNAMRALLTCKCYACFINSTRRQGTSQSSVNNIRS